MKRIILPIVEMELCFEVSQCWRGVSVFVLGGLNKYTNED